MSGTTNVGRRLTGNSRSGAIPVQSLTPTHNASLTTKRMSNNPAAFQITISSLPDGPATIPISRRAKIATMMSPIAAG